MTFDPKATGTRIHQRRSDLGISLTQASIALHVSREHLKKIESGNRAPSLELLIEIAQYYQLSTDYLLMGGSQYDDIRAEFQVIIAAMQKLDKKISGA